MVPQFPPSLAPSCQPRTDDETSSTQSESSQLSGAAVNCFEGPEKNLHVVFRPGVGRTNGFRNINREQLDALLTAGKCSILSRTSNAHFDAYVLSESSLFVYSHKLVIKTCGTTTLLLTLPLIFEYAAELDMEIAWVSYSRKNYTFPEEQKYPHTSFQTEVAYLSEFFPDGTAHVLGPLNHDHWYMYVWDADEHVLELPIEIVDPRPVACTKSASTLHVLMQDMSPCVAKHFFKTADDVQEPEAIISERMTHASGIGELVPGLVIDAYAFDPCGYSMNGLLDDAYYTIHITPESQCSYVSFETNAPVECYEALIRKVLQCFRPAKYSVSVYASCAAVEAAHMKLFSSAVTTINADLAYKRKGGHTQAIFEGGYTCLNANWGQVALSPRSPAAVATRAPTFASVFNG